MRQIFWVTAVLALQIVVEKAKAETATPLDDHSQLQGYSLVFGLASVSRMGTVGTACAEHLKSFEAAVLRREPWAMKMLDASGGMPQTGFLFGNHYWLGNRAMCAAVHRPVPFTFSPHISHRGNAALLHDTADFSTDYRVLYLQHNSTWQLDFYMLFYEPLIHVGLCVPSICSNAEITQLMTLYLQQELHVAGRIYELQPMQVAYVKDLQLKMEVFTRTSVLILCAMLVGTAVLTLAAFRQKRGSSAPENGNICNVIECFDLERNWQHFFAPRMENQKSPFSAINGLRFFCACAVVYYHTLVPNYFSIANKIEFLGIATRLGNLNVAIDVFFVLSGFFYTYHALRNATLLTKMRTNNFLTNFKLLAYLVFYRLIRLLPLYIFILCASDIGSKIYEDISVFHIKYRMFEQCEKYWWRNLLFIQNLFDASESCAFWTWSLSNEVQYFILATIIFFIYAKHASLAKWLVALLSVVSIWYTIAVGFSHNFDLTLESIFANLDTIYAHPLPRILPYVLGSVAAYLYVQHRPALESHKRCHELLGNASLFIFGWLMFVTPQQQHSVSYSMALLLMQRVIFALSACCILLACGCGRLKWACRLLEWDLLQRYSQCTYVMYLFNPGLIIIVYAANQVSLHVYFLGFFVDFIGFMVVLIVAAVPFTLMFEVPYANMARLLLQRVRKSKVQ